METNTEVTATDTTVNDGITVESNVVPEAEPAKVEPETDKTTEAETPATEPKVEPTEPKPINPRTAQRKAEKERLLTENATMREQLRQLQEQMSPKADEPKARDLSKKPDLQDYDDAVEYTLDMARYERKQEASQAELQKQTKALAERADVVRAEKPDYDEKISALVQSQLVTPEIEKAIYDSPMGADIGYHLASYGADLMTLRGLPAESLPKAIKAIEAFIKKGGEQEKPKVTKAEPPIAPPGVTANVERDFSSYTQEDWEKMPQAEFNKRFMKK